jgi:tetratricopeptide (TPR) repeat protein
VNWKVVGAAAALLLVAVAAAGAWVVVGSQNTSEACARLAQRGEAALAQSHLTAVNARIAEAEALGCGDAMLGDLRRRAAALSARLKREADDRQKKQAEEQRKKEADQKLAANCNALRRELRDFRDNPGGISTLIGRAQKMGCPSSTTQVLRAASYYYQGRALYRQRAYGRAIGYFDRSLRLYSAYGAFHLRGLCHLRMGNYQAALRDFDSAVKKRPGSYAAHANRGTAYYRLGRRSEAIRDFRKALEIRPDGAYARRWLNRIQYQ